MFSNRIGSALVALCAVFASTRALAADSSTLIRGANIFDGVRVVDTADVLVHDDKIERIGKGIESTKGVAVVDGRGCTLLPGLIDSHTQVVAGEVLEQALAFGVTTEIGMLTLPELAAKVKREDLPTRADLRTAGTFAVAPGGHARPSGAKIPSIDKPDEAAAFVDARIAEGSDHIGIDYDTGRSVGMPFPRMSKETLAAVVRAAHRRGKLAVVRVGDYPSALESLDAGADGLASVPFGDAPADGSFATRMKASGAFITPTLASVEKMCATHGGETLTTDERLVPFLKPADVGVLKISNARNPMVPELDFDGPLASVRSLHTAGVRILAGSAAPSSGVLHGTSLHRELELLVQCGLKPAEALASATSVPASRFKLKDRGVIAAGMRADLLLVKGDATQDIRATRAIVGVWRAGRLLDRDAIRAQVAQAKLDAEKWNTPGLKLVSDFEGEKISGALGVRWSVQSVSTGTELSVADMTLAKGGAQSSKASLKITGSIGRGLPNAFAGAMFSPGEKPFVPFDVTRKKSITFWAKGDGHEASLMLFARKFGGRPARQTFTPGAEWKKFSVEFKAFDGFDGADLDGVLFGGGPKPGKFEFQIDDVAFE